MVKSASNLFWSRRQVLRFLATTAGVISLNSCRSGNEAENTSSQDKKLTSMTIGSSIWIGFTPLFIAQEKGFFQDLGIDVTYKIFGTNTQAMAAVLAGQMDGFASSSSEVVIGATKSQDHSIVLIQDNSIGGDGILARNRIKSIADFKGEKVAVQKGNVSHFFLLQVLQEAGLTEKDIIQINAEPAEAAAAYLAGNADIAVTYAPFIGRANKAQPDGRIIYDSSRMPTAIIDFYQFSNKLIEENPAAVQAFVNGIFMGLKFLEQNREEGLAIAAKRLEVTPEQLASDLAGVNMPDAKTNIEMLANPNSELYVLNPLKSMAEFLLEQKEIEKIPDLESLLEPKFVKAAL